MILGKVTGTVVATAKHDSYLGKKLMIVEPIDELGAVAGPEFLAVDEAQAGVGDTVLVLKEGNGVRQILHRTDADPLPILELIVGIVDHVEVGA